jgi:signal transduction histidine kinase
LGLPFCQQLMQRMGGRIAVESDALTGTVIHLYIPIAKNRAPAQPPQHRPAEANP